MPPPASVARNKCLLVCESQLAVFLTSRLQRSMPEREFHQVVAVDEAWRKLQDEEYHWLIAFDTSPASSESLSLHNTRHEIPPAVELAREWTRNQSDRHAIIITEGASWDRLPWKMRPGLLGCPYSALFHCPDLLPEMIHASEGGYPYVFPTTVKLRLHAIQDSESARPVLSFEGLDEGPWGPSLDLRLGSMPDVHLQSDCGMSMNQWGEASRRFVSCLPETRKQAVVAAGQSLWNAAKDGPSTPSVLTWIRESERDIRCRIWEDTGHEAPCPPFIHVHLVGSPEMLSVPIELGADQNEGTEMLCERIPFVWRPKASTSDGNRWNSADPGRLTIVYSCASDVLVPGRTGSLRGFKAIKQLKPHVKRIAGSLSSLGGRPVHATKVARLQKALTAVPGGSGASAYVISHGIHDGSADDSGIVVGPSLPDGRGEIVDAMKLTPLEGLQPRSFLYLNTCELGCQQSFEQAKGSYYAGFAQAAVQGGICREIICNRWGVTAKFALLQADLFFRLKPRTVQGRASALMHARRRVLRQSRREDNQDVTGLAAMHVYIL